jgi:hypothetical protein
LFLGFRSPNRRDSPDVRFRLVRDSRQRGAFSLFVDSKRATPSALARHTACISMHALLRDPNNSVPRPVVAKTLISHQKGPNAGRRATAGLGLAVAVACVKPGDKAPVVHTDARKQACGLAPTRWMLAGNGNHPDSAEPGFLKASPPSGGRFPADPARSDSKSGCADHSPQAPTQFHRTQIGWGHFPLQSLPSQLPIGNKSQAAYPARPATTANARRRRQD